MNKRRKVITVINQIQDKEAFFAAADDLIANAEDAVISPIILTVIELLQRSLIDVLDIAVPLYDHVPLVSVVENTRFWDECDCTPGTGVRRSPTMLVVMGSEVSACTSAPDMIGVIANVHVEPASSPANAQERADAGTFCVVADPDASTSVSTTSSTKMQSFSV